MNKEQALKHRHGPAGHVPAAIATNERIVTLFIEFHEEFKLASDKLSCEVIEQLNLAYNCNIALIRSRQIDMTEKALFAHQFAVSGFNQSQEEIVSSFVLASSRLLLPEVDTGFTWSWIKNAFLRCFPKQEFQI